MNKEILKELGFENVNSYEELVEELLKDSDGFEKLLYAMNTYSEEVEYVREEMKNLEDDYARELSDLNAQINEQRNKANQSVRDYNEYSKELAEYDSSKEIEVSVANRLQEIEKELASISRIETLLNGKISKKSQDKKEALEQERKILIDDKQAYKNLQVEARNNYDKALTDRKELETRKEQVLQEKVEKVLQLNENITQLMSVKKEYENIQAKVFEKLYEEKKNVDKEFEEFINGYNSETSELNKAAMGQQYVDMYYKKKASDDRFSKALSYYGMTTEEFERVSNLSVDTVDDMIKYYSVVDPIKADDLYLQSKIWEKRGLQPSTISENFKNWKEKNNIEVGQIVDVLPKEEMVEEQPEEVIEQPEEIVEEVKEPEVEEVVQEETNQGETTEEVVTEPVVEETKQEEVAEEVVEPENVETTEEVAEEEPKLEEVRIEQPVIKSSPKTIEDYWNMMYPPKASNEKKETKPELYTDKFLGDTDMHMLQADDTPVMSDKEDIDTTLNNIPVTTEVVENPEEKVNEEMNKVQNELQEAVAEIQNENQEVTEEVVEPQVEETKVEEVVSEPEDVEMHEVTNEEPKAYETEWGNEEDTEWLDTEADEEKTSDNGEELDYFTPLNVEPFNPDIEDYADTNVEEVKEPLVEETKQEEVSDEVVTEPVVEETEEETQNKKSLLQTALDSINEYIKNTNNNQIYHQVLNLNGLEGKTLDEEEKREVSRAVNSVKNELSNQNTSLKRFLGLPEESQREFVEEFGTIKRIKK